MKVKAIQQRGFTLIELVVVIVILGILAVTALPKFVDLSAEAHNAAAAGVAGSIASGTAVNYAAKKAGKAGAVTLNGANVCAAATLAPFVTGVTLKDSGASGNAEFNVGGTGACNGASADGTAVTCTATASASGSTAQNATVICAQ